MRIKGTTMGDFYGQPDTVTWAWDGSTCPDCGELKTAEAKYCIACSNRRKGEVRERVNWFMARARERKANSD